MMAKVPPPRFMLLEKAAKVMSERLGQLLEPADLLGCAERGEFLIHVRLPAAYRLVRVVPYKEGCDEFLAEVGNHLTISLPTVRGLLYDGFADFDGMAEFRDLPEWFTGVEPLLGDNGKPMRRVVLTWRLAEGETPQKIQLSDCRILDDSLEELIADYEAKPETTAAQLEQSATDVEPVRMGRPPSIQAKAEIVRQIVVAFEQVAETQFNPGALPGKATDLLDACQRIEKSLTGKTYKMMATQEAFNAWLRAASYSFPNGRTPKDQATFWTHLVPAIMGKINAGVFTGVIPEKPL